MTGLRKYASVFSCAKRSGFLERNIHMWLVKLILGRGIVPCAQDNADCRDVSTLLARRLRVPGPMFKPQPRCSHDLGLLSTSSNGPLRDGPQLRAHPQHLLHLRRELTWALAWHDGPNHWLVSTHQDRVTRGSGKLLRNKHDYNSIKKKIKKK